MLPALRLDALLPFLQSFIPFGCIRIQYSSRYRSIYALFVPQPLDTVAFFHIELCRHCRGIPCCCVKNFHGTTSTKQQSTIANNVLIAVVFPFLLVRFGLSGILIIAHHFFSVLIVLPLIDNILRRLSFSFSFTILPCFGHPSPFWKLHSFHRSSHFYRWYLQIMN